MAKLAQTSVKYLIKASFTAEGVVEKPDIIGALFGQTEGLLGPDLDLRELQRTGRIGRIEVTFQNRNGKTAGEITIPSSLDSTETSLIAATIETIERVGPCTTKIRVDKIEDLRTTKRRYMMDRAKELLSGLMQEFPETAVVTEELMESVRAAEVMDFRGLPAGPDAPTADAIVLVEGRADVVNLLRNGIKNAVAFGGTNIPDFIIALTKEREVTAFLDGDRGGDLILKELVNAGAEIDFVARAPEGKEVEELTKKELFKSLREKTPFEQAQLISGGRPLRRSMPQERRIDAREEAATSKSEREVAEAAVGERPAGRRGFFTRERERPALKLDEDTKEFFKSQLNEVLGTRAAAIFDKDMQFAGRIPLREISTTIKRIERPTAVVLDGQVSRDFARLAAVLGVKYVVGTAAEDKGVRGIVVLTSEDL